MMSSLFHLDEYILNASEFLQDYEIHSEKQKQFYHIQKGYLANSDQRVKIYRRQINVNHPNFKFISNRLNVLMKGFNEGYILADNIFLDKKPKSQFYDLYVVEPDFSNFTKDDRYLQLNNYLKKNPEYPLKKKIFENILIIFQKIHSLGFAHMCLNPKNIWIEADSIVYIRPFIIDLEEINHKVNDSCLKNKYSSFYISPEETFISDYVAKSKNFENLIHCDLWAIGCIFSDMFLTKNPLFWTKDAEEKLYKFFEMLNLPEKHEIPFLDENYYREIKKILSKKPIKQQILLNLLKNYSLHEKQIISSLLNFDPKKRLDCESLLNFDFFQKRKPLSSEKKISKKLFSSAKSKKNNGFLTDSSQKNAELSDDLEFSAENNEELIKNEELNEHNEIDEFIEFNEINEKKDKSNQDYDDLNDNNEAFHEINKNYEDNNNSMITNESNHEEWENIAPMITPKYNSKEASINKKSHDEKKEEKNRIFSSKSVYLVNKEPSYELNTTNFTNITKKKEKEIWIEMKFSRVFIFQSIRNAEISIQLLRRTRNGTIVPQDSINYKRFDGQNNLFERNIIKTNKIKKSEIEKMQKDDILLIHFNCRWEKTSVLLGFIEIPLAELYSLLKEVKKNQGYPNFSEWFNIMSQQNDDDELSIIGKCKIEIYLSPEKAKGFLDSLERSCKKEKVNLLNQIDKKIAEKKKVSLHHGHSNKKKIDDIMKDMDELNSNLLKKNTKYFYENKEDLYQKTKNDKEFGKIINRLQSILFSDDTS